jgi:thioesterase domain-containing protein
MTYLSPLVFILPGAGAESIDRSLFRAGREDSTRFETIAYPGWQRIVDEGLSAEVLISELAAQIVAKAPDGPIRIVGVSIGGHFGYAVALRLQSIGRQIAGLCAVDTFMIASSGPRRGWIGRHLEEGLRLLRKRRLHDFAALLQSLFWRTLLRIWGDRLPRLLSRLGFSSRASANSALDPTLEREMSMRLLLREVAPWIASLDREPVQLNAPVVLLRTRLAAGDDSAWRRRCPNIEIIEIAGDHNTYFEPENADSFREAFAKGTPDWRGEMGK